MNIVELGQIAVLNPRAEPVAANETISFVGMAELNAETATATPRENRVFADVSKGYTIFRDGDVLAAKITPCWENGKIGQARLDTEVGVGSTEFHVLRPGSSLCARYLLHFLRLPAIRAAGKLRMTGSAGQKRVPVSFFDELRIPLPSLGEQHRVAAILDHADALRAKRRQVLAHLDTLTQSIFHDMFEDSVWPEEPLASVVRAGTIVTYGIVQAGEEFRGGVPYIRTGDIAGGRILTSRLRHTSPELATRYERSTVRTGDIVMSIRATVGTTAVVPAELDGANLTQGTARIAPGTRALGPYLFGYLNSEQAQRWIQAQVKGATFREITLGRLRQLGVPLPPLRLQQTYAMRLEEIEILRATVARGLALDEELIGALQSRAFRGEL